MLEGGEKARRVLQRATLAPLCSSLDRCNRRANSPLKLERRQRKQILETFSCEMFFIDAASPSAHAISCEYRRRLRSVPDKVRIDARFAARRIARSCQARRY